jgi:hypothetical protein
MDKKTKMLRKPKKSEAVGAWDSNVVGKDGNNQNIDTHSIEDL